MCLTMVLKIMVDIVNGKTDKIVEDQTSIGTVKINFMEWWKKLATKRYNKLKEEDRLRKDLEVWTEESQIDIIM